jgi:hypothetical protein
MKTRTIGYVFFGHDNGSYAFFERDVPRCACGLYDDKWNQMPLDFRLSNRSLDVSATYDGVKVVSERVRQIYIREGWSGLEFRALSLEPGFFQVISTVIVAFDVLKRKTRFLDRCTICTRFRSVSGATPVFLKERDPIPKCGFVRSDIEFGTGPEMHPLIMCGVEVGKVLKTARLKGLDLERIVLNSTHQA